MCTSLVRAGFCEKRRVKRPASLTVVKLAAQARSCPPHRLNALPSRSVIPRTPPRAAAASTAMGASGSKTALHVHVDRPHYYSGNSVSGCIVLHVAQGVEFKSILIKVTGTEKCQWTERNGNNSSTTYSGKHSIFKAKLPVVGAGALPAGDYKWPFAFQLPANCPGSFSYSSGDSSNARASITYKIKAACDQAGLLKADIKSAASIEVLQHAKGPPPQAVVLADEQSLSFLCCFNKGVVGLALQADCDTHLPGGVLRLQAQVDNRSTVGVPYVEARLQQHLTLVAHHLFGRRTHRIAVTRALCRQQQPGFPNGAPGYRSDYGTMELPLDRRLEATCMGQIITSNYQLEVAAKTGCCLSEVCLRAPILVNDPEPAAPLQPPQDWAPQVYSTVQLQLPTPDGYQHYSAVAPAPAAVFHQQQYYKADAGMPVVSVEPCTPPFAHQQPQQSALDGGGVDHIAAFAAGGGAYDQPAQGAGWEVPGHAVGCAGRA